MEQENCSSTTFGHALFDDIEPEFFFVDGKRHVKPYLFTYKTFCKERWLRRPLIDIFHSEFVDRSKEYYSKAIMNGLIRVNGNTVSEAYILRDNDLITHNIERYEPPVSGEDIKIIHESEDMLVVEKPTPMPVHPSGRYRFNSLVGILMTVMGYKKLSLINRIDKSVSGIVILAKNESAARILHASMSGRQIRKEYICKVKGLFPPALECHQPLSTFDHRLCLNAVISDGKPSSTLFESLSSDGNYSIIKARPLTGRSHQIRVHLQFLGYPICNDSLYSSDAWPTGTTPPFSREELREVCNRMLSRKSEPKTLLCTCDLCKNEGFGEELYESIYLHAYRYSSSEFEFRSHLPCWAKLNDPEKS